LTTTLNDNQSSNLGRGITIARSIFVIQVRKIVLTLNTQTYWSLTLVEESTQR
jgi:hypothetical protein